MAPYYQNKSSCVNQLPINIRELIKDFKIPMANLINVLVAFLKPACVLIFSGAFLSYEKFQRLDFLYEAQKSFQP